MASLRTMGCKSFGLRSVTIACALTTIGVAASLIPGATDVAAQPTNQGCPNGYALVDTHPAYCFSSSGDVVEPAANEHSASLPGCRQGYARLGTLCISPTSGDVELAETPNGTQASR